MKPDMNEINANGRAELASSNGVENAHLAGASGSLPVDQPQREAREDQRGVVIILALAVLAIIALAALSYMTVVRSDRVSSQVVAERTGFERQPAVVIEHIGALLTADLFGQKIVTADVPRTVPNNPAYPNWPRPFEDGNQWDYPHTDPWMLQDHNMGRELRATEPSPENRIAQPSQPWLASTEPLWDLSSNLSNLDRTKVWLQVSNLRTGYRWDPSVGTNGSWVRSDGKFADLLQFFYKPTDDGSAWYGNSRVDFLGLSSTPVNDRGEFIEPTGGVHFPAVGAPAQYTANDPFTGNSMHSTAVWGYPMSEMTILSGDGDTGPAVLDNADERLWVDTDGDGYPDARWQVLDALGDYGGLRWFVASRIIDASGLVNYNTALEYSYAGNNLAQAISGTQNKIDSTSLDSDPRGSNGRTPADVDLFGLIYEMSGGTATNGPSGVFDTGPGSDYISMRNDRLTFGGNPNASGQGTIDAYEDHLYNGLGLRGFFASADRAADVLLSGADQPGEANEPSYFNPPGGGFGGGQTWRTSEAGIPSINGFPSIPNYTQVFQPFAGLPDHAISVADINNGGFTTLTESTGTNPLPTLSQSQRRAFYELGILPGGASPLTRPTQYPLTDLVDLRSYFGTNTEQLSQVELRFDGPQGADGFGNGLAYLPDGGMADQLVYGPMRSREPSLTSRLAGENTDEVRPTPEQIYYDLRRLLTPHSGAAPFSVVPLLNPAHPAYQNGSLLTKPIITKPFVTDSQVADLFSSYVWALAPQAARLSQSGNSNAVVPANWRGDMPLPYTDLAGTMNNPDPGPYYGGGMTDLDGINFPGPARRLWNNASGFLAQPVGASYALRAALAMTVNTINAANRATGLDGEHPTIVRFYPVGEDLPPGKMLPTSVSGGPVPAVVPGVKVHSVAGRFPFGDLPSQADHPDLLPTAHLGAADSGITAIGLQRQPFLVGAYALAVYENPLGQLWNPVAGATTLVNIDTQEESSRFGSIFAIEIGNPWDTPLSMDGYEVRLQVGKIVSALDASSIRIDLSTDNTPIPAGETRVFYVLTYYTDTTAAARTEATMEAIRDRWQALLNAGSIVAIDETTGDISDRVVIENPDTDALPDDGILFNRLTTEEITLTPVLLVRRLSGGFADAASRRSEILVDRMLPDFSDALGGGGDTMPFPAFYPTAEAVTNLRFAKVNSGFSSEPPGADPKYLFVRVTRESEVRRPALNAMLDAAGGFVGGFPAYVIERPSQNALYNSDITDADLDIVATTFSNFDDLSNALEQDPTTPFDTNGDLNSAFSKDEGQIRIGTDPDAGTPGDLLEMEDGTLALAESFELYVPTTGILSKADVLRLTAFAHLYRPAGPNARAISVTQGNAAFSSFLLDNQPFNTDAGVDAPGITDPSEPFWLTVSEQLGMDANLYLGEVGAEVAVNPYFHVLNPLRDHRQAPTDAANSRRADALTIPPAVRLMDAVEVFDTNVGVIPGRININNAPDQVLKAIPMLMPRRDVVAWTDQPYLGVNDFNSHLLSPMNGTGQSGERFMRTYEGTRIETLAAYRDRYGRVSSALPNSIGVNAFVGLQDMGVPFRQPGGWRNNQPRGIISIGELINMHRWRVASGDNPDGSSGYFQPLYTTDDAVRGFAQLAVNTNGIGRVPNFGAPFEMETLGEKDTDAPLPDVFGAPFNNSTGTRVGKPADDVNERLAIFRAMANIIETRSDVYLATFVVRAYKPSVIESIRVTNNENYEAAARAMNSERFRPEYESRWLVLLDRSNVRQPTDRPKVLLKVELPPARR